MGHSGIRTEQQWRNELAKTTQQQRRRNQRCHHLNIPFRKRFLVVIFIMLAASSRCRAASFLRHQARRHCSIAFASSTTNAASSSPWASDRANNRVSLLSSYARLRSEEYDNDDEPLGNVPRGRPPPRQSLPPPRARPMPPTLESNDNEGGSSFSSEFPDFDVQELEASDDYYDPNGENGQSYGFFSANVDTDTSNENDETSDATLTPHSSSHEEEAPSSPFIGQKQTFPSDDAFMNNDMQEFVPNPHNYWDDDDIPTVTTSTSTETPVDETTKETPSKVKTPLESETKATSKANKEVKATFRAAPSKMPPRDLFASRPPESNRQQVYLKASTGNAITSEVDILTAQLEKLEQDIYTQNNHKEFNIKSTKQVSQVLFGQPGQSTNKETLEAMGGAGNVLADRILQYRSLARKIARLSKKREHRDNGTLVKNVSATRRPSKARNAKEPMQLSDESVAEGDPLLLVDASAYIFRAYYSMPPLHRADGMPVGAVLGFCNMLNRLVLTRMLEGKCPRLVLVFDAKGKTFRHDMYEEYKAHRPECPVDLVPQFDLIRAAAEAYGIQQLEAPNYEADDVIATLASMALSEGVDTNILSGDKDLMQLITPQDVFPSIQMVDPMTMSRVSHDVVVSKWGVTPDQLGDVLALAGDSADNIPGVPGIGPKIAAALIDEYGSLEELLEQMDTVKQKGRRQKLMDNVENARLSRQLVELERELPLEKMTFPENITSAAELRMAPLDSDRLLAFYEDMGLKDMKRRVEARLKQKKVTRKKYNNKRPKATIPTPDDYKDVPF